MSQLKKDLLNQTYLTTALDEGPASVELALKAGASLHATDRDGNTALILAARKGDVEMAEFLIGLGLEINAQNNDGETALFVAASKGHHDMIRSLLAHGADANICCGDKTAFCELVIQKKCDAEMVALFKKAGTDLDAERWLSAPPLILATWKEHEEGVLALLAAGADPNCQDELGNAALAYALEQSQIIIDALVNAGADIELENKRGVSPLTKAFGNKQDDMARRMKVLATAFTNAKELSAFAKGTQQPMRPPQPLRLKK
jgi:ankyrin repeat protein